MRRSGGAIRRLGAALVVCAAACGGARGGPTATPPRLDRSAEAPAATADLDRAALLAAANRVTAVSLRASGTISWGPEGPVSGLRLLLARSGALRIETDGPTGFVMASDGARLRVRRGDGAVRERPAWAPAAPVGAPLDERLAAADLLDALLPGPFVDRADEPELLVATPAPEGPEIRSFTRVQGAVRPLGTLRLSVEPLAPVRWQRFTAAGDLGATVEYLRWDGVPGAPPRRVRICSQGSRSCITLDLQRVELDPPTRAADWRLDANG